MKYKTHYLKLGICDMIDKSYPKFLEVGKTYKMSYTFYPTSETDGIADNISIKEVNH